jgi:hypothetical protein
MDTHEHTTSVVRRIQAQMSKPHLGMSATEHSNILEQEVEYELIGVRRVVHENLHKNWESLFPQIAYSPELLSEAVEQHIVTIRDQVRREAKAIASKLQNLIQIAGTDGAVSLLSTEVQATLMQSGNVEAAYLTPDSVIVRGLYDKTEKSDHTISK